LPHTQPPSGDTGRVIRGFFSVPVYVSTPEPSLQSRLVLDPATGLPVYQRNYDYEFTVIIPNSVLANPAPSKVLQVRGVEKAAVQCAGVELRIIAVIGRSSKRFAAVIPYT
jgi:hypothetical protein